MVHDADPPITDHVSLDVLDLLSGKWHPVVILTLQEQEPLGFSEILDVLSDISGKVLSDTLEELVESGVVDRTVVNESPLRVEYELTDAGRGLEPVMETLADWGERHLEQSQPTVLLADGDPRITAMFESWLDDRYELIRAHDREAIGDLRQDPPDVLLIERSLPGADTVTLIASLRSDSRTILLLGRRPDLDLLAVECDDVLRKPVVRDTAIQTIEEQLERAGEPENERRQAALSAKCSLLKSVLPQETLDGAIEFFEARTRIEALEEPSEN